MEVQVEGDAAAELDADLAQDLMPCVHELWCRVGIDTAAVADQCGLELRNPRRRVTPSCGAATQICRCARLLMRNSPFTIR